MPRRSHPAADDVRAAAGPPAATAQATGAATSGQIAPAAEPALLDPGSRMGGVRAGAIVFVGIAGANLGNAIFHIVAGRWLGPSPYGDVAALLAVLGLIAYPLTGAQLAMAQHVAHFAALRDRGAIVALYRRSLGAGLALGVALTVVLASLSVPIQRALDVGSLAAVLLTAAATLPAVLTPIVWGLAQGLERFVVFSASQIAMPVARIVLLVPFLAVGFAVAGALGSTALASAIAVLVPAWLLRGWLRGSGHAAVDVRAAAKSLVPAMGGILALTSLTTIDVVVAKIAFGSDEAGHYGAASLVGRVILYMPAAIVSVLLPKVSSRAATGRATGDILRSSLLATGALCAVATAVYALAPDFVIRVVFGGEYADAGRLLWLFGIAMSGYALLNVLFAYHLGHRSSAASWLLAGGAVVQLGAFALFHGSPEELLAVSIAVAAALLAAYPLVSRALSRG